MALGTTAVALSVLKEQGLSKIKSNWLVKNVLHFTIFSQIHFYSTSLVRRDAMQEVFAQQDQTLSLTVTVTITLRGSVVCEVLHIQKGAMFITVLQ